MHVARAVGTPWWSLVLPGSADRVAPLGLPATCPHPSVAQTASTSLKVTAWRPGSRCHRCSRDLPTVTRPATQAGPAACRQIPQSSTIAPNPRRGRINSSTDCARSLFALFQSSKTCNPYLTFPKDSHLVLVRLQGSIFSSIAAAELPSWRTASPQHLSTPSGTFFSCNTPQALGTAIHATPLIPALRHAVPDCRIAVASSGFANRVPSRNNPGVDHLFATPSPLDDLLKNAAQSLRQQNPFNGVPYAVITSTGNERTWPRRRLSSAAPLSESASLWRPNSTRPHYPLTAR